MKLVFGQKSQLEIRLILLAQFAIILYYLPYFILGENANILIHDNLDSNVTWIKILMDNNAIFSAPSKIIDQVLDGIPVYNIYGTYDISLVVFQVFGVFYGYVINKLLISFIGFWGMYLLLKKHFLGNANTNTPYILAGISLAFALLPFWSFSAHVQGIPFVLFAFLNLRNGGKHFSNYLILLLFAFYSSLILSGFFLLIILSLVFVYDVIKNRKINWFYFFGLAGLSIAYLISHIPLIYGFLFDDVITHRLEFHRETVGFKKAIFETAYIYLKGQQHAHSKHILFVLPLSFFLTVFYKSFNRTIKFIFAFIILTSLFYGIRDIFFIKPILDRIADVVPIHLQRFHFLHPMFWYILLAIVLSWSIQKFKYSSTLLYSVLILQFAFVIKHHEIWANKDFPSFKEFYAEETFTRVKKLIDRPIDAYKIISIGIHPAVTQYNGFGTLDGYFPNYSLAYKHEFRKVISEELNRDETIKKYFDNWGNRCYAFSSEIGLEFDKAKKGPINQIKYDFQQLKAMGGDYIISAASINDSLNTDLKLIEKVDLPNSYWDIYLYEIQ